MANISPVSPIVRSTPEKNLATFTKNEKSIYNKFSPYDGSSGFGFDQPFVYTKITDSNFSKNLTKYDSQALPVGSTIRDLQRVGKFLGTGRGILFLGKQLLLQNQNSFNETRIYNPLSVLVATGKSATLGLVEAPKRHFNGGNGLLDTFKSALGGALGSEEQPTIQGTATGQNALSNYASARGGAKAGLVRYNTGTAASNRFAQTWVAQSSNSGGGGFLANLGQTLKNTLNKAIPSTNPMGMLGGSPKDTWEYRPEYPKNSDGVFFAFLRDSSQLLGTRSQLYPFFYNQPISAARAYDAGKTSYREAGSYHKYYSSSPKGGLSGKYVPGGINDYDTQVAVPLTVDGQKGSLDYSLNATYKKMVEALDKATPPKNVPMQARMGPHMYSEVTDLNPTPRGYKVYKDIPDGKNGKKKFQTLMEESGLTLRERSFAHASGSGLHDSYNTLSVIAGKRNEVPEELLPLVVGASDKNQSADVIFFYFYDLIKQVYIPFRATVSSVSDQNSADWEDITYMGRADKLFVYKGFSRDVNLAFTVYANSIKELVPMWGRINYLVGLTRPSKYTGKAVITNTNVNEADVAGGESAFIYPPMVTFRLGDMYVDQPAVISSIGLTIPDDANWESYRGDDYEYLFGPNATVKVKGAKSRQLPLKVDISLSMKLLEKERAQTGNELFGHNSKL